MTGTASAPSAARLWSSPQSAVILLVAAAAWAATVARALDMGDMTGSMGLGMAAFLVMWGLMMAAMMLPAVAPLSSLYVRTFRDHPWRRTAMLISGYLLVWVAIGIPFYVLARLVDRLDQGTWPARGLTAAILVVAGVWQLTGAKDACLRHCRSPLGLLFHYGSFKGRTRDLRVGIHHGGWCIGCCWALMLLLVAFGFMNLIAMVALAALILAEKRWSWGEQLARVAGIVLIGLALAALLAPGVVHGLGHQPMSDMT